MSLHRAFVFVFFATTAALAQCDLQPTATGRGVPSISGFAIRGCEWDPDGAGPLGRRLVVSGAFHLAGDLPVPGLAMFDPVTDQWSPLGDLEGELRALVVLPNGLLVAGGLFASPAPGGSLLQVWNGSSWSAAVPQPQGSLVVALAVAPNGDLFASCLVGSSGTVQRLDANGWQVVGTMAPGPFSSFGVARDLAFASNGDLLVAGIFGSGDAVVADHGARWNGISWSAVGSGVDGTVADLWVAGNGDLYAGGLFSLGSPSQRVNVARWNGSSWQALGTGTQSPQWPEAGVFALAEMPGGIVAGGQFDAAGGTPAYKVASWNGSAWSAMGGGLEQYGPSFEPSIVQALVPTSNGELFALGSFASVSGLDGSGVARWNGVSWRPLRSVGIGAPPTVLHRSTSGDLYLGGSFRSIDGVVCNGIARRGASGWLPLGGGIDVYPNTSYGPFVEAVASLPNGDIVVGGSFATAGGVTAPALALWDGSAWSPIGGGLALSFGTPAVAALHVDAIGDLYVAGVFDTAGGVPVESLARWNGSQWSAVGSGLATGSGQVTTIRAVTTSPLGDVYVGGQFGFGGAGSAKVAVFSGGAWQPLGTLDGEAYDLLLLSNGDLLVAGSFQNVGSTQVGHVARWSNGTWSAVGGLGGPGPGPGLVRRLRELPGGALLAAGRIEQNGIFYRFARWDGAAWTAFDPLNPSLLSPSAFDLAVEPSGEVLVAGDFTVVGGVASANLMRLVAPCAASASAAGTGCVGSGGVNQLAAGGLPWLGEILVATASGMPNNGVLLTVLGLGTLSLPLPSLLPQGGAGCELLVTPDALGLVVPSGAVALVPLPLPLVPSLVGGVLHLQVVPIEFGVGGAITSVTSTNRLGLVLGIF